MNLSELTTLRLGGPIEHLEVCERDAELVAAVGAADASRAPLLLLAGGSNVVAPDDGYAGTVALIRTAGIERRSSGDCVLFEVESGESWDAFVQRCVVEGLAGIECLSGIPGSVGATPIQNVGAYGQEVKDTVVRVRVYDRERREIYEMAGEECGFTYRSSVFKRTPDHWVVLGVTFALRRQHRSAPIRYAELARALGIPPGERAPLGEVRAAVLELRRAKGMVLDPSDPDTRSAGSFFLNPILEPEEFQRLKTEVAERLGPAVQIPAFPEADGRVKTSAAWLIERTGFRKGYGDAGGIAISSKHTLALTNRGRGTTSELLALAAEISQGVHDRFGVTLQPEPVILDGSL